MIIGVKRDLSPDNSVPGPGHYFIHSPSKTGPDFSKSNRHDSKPDPDNGPGTYNVQMAIEGAAYTIGERREQQQHDETPGPG